MLRLRRSDRARHMMLRIIPATGEPELVLPRRTPLGTGLAFARDKAGWLQRQLDAIPPPVPRLNRRAHACAPTASGDPAPRCVPVPSLGCR